MNDTNAMNTLPEDGIETVVGEPYKPSLTSHLVRVRRPSQDIPADAVEIPADTTPLPDTLEQANAMVKEAQALPHGTAFEKKVKAAKLARIATRLHELAQTPAAPKLTMQHLSNWHPKVDTGNRRAALETLASKYPVVRGLLSKTRSKK